jgi:hypothetical protein
MPTERGSNGATTSINQSGGITSSATSVTVAASTSVGFPNLTATPGQFRVQVEQELWLVTATSGTDGVNWTITRHIEGTIAAAHVNGSQVVQKLTWAALENLAASGGTPAASAVTFTPAGGIAATDVQAALQEVDTEKAPKASPTFTGVVTTPALAVSGLTGSLSASRYVGATASGAPSTGAHLVGDWCWALDGHLWLCTANGTPGTWVDATGGGGTGTTDVLLDYNLGSDVTGTTLTADTWVDLIANQTFTVGAATSSIEVSVSGTINVLTSSGNRNFGVRLVIDSGGTPTNVIFAGTITDTNASNALAGSSLVNLGALTAASHTIKLQGYCATVNGSAYCRASSLPNVERLRIQVLERR